MQAKDQMTCNTVRFARYFEIAAIVAKKNTSVFFWCLLIVSKSFSLYDVDALLCRLMIDCTSEKSDYIILIKFV